MIATPPHRLAVLVLAGLLGAGAAAAQNGAVEVPAVSQAAADTDDAPGEGGVQGAVEAPGPATGDAWIDGRFADVDQYAGRHRDAFIDELARYRDAPRELVLELLDEDGWAPSDVFFACSLAQVVGRSCRYVSAAYAGEDPGMGWGAVASRLGAAPGSAPYLRLKRGYVESYGRWARPLELDAALRRDFPEHGKPPPGSG